MLGAFIGAGIAMWGEFAYVRALRNGTAEVGGRTHMHALANALRYGMTLLLLASLGLSIVAFVIHTSVQPALTASYWIVITFALLIIVMSWVLSRRHVSFSFGSATLFSAWWLLVYLTIGRLPFSFGTVVALYVVCTAVLYAVLQCVRFFAKKSA